MFRGLAVVSILCPSRQASPLGTPGPYSRRSDAMLSGVFYETLYRPLFNALIALYEFLPGQDLGVAIVVLTVLVRLALVPVFHRQLQSQRKLASLQSEVSAIQRGTKDRAEQSRRVFALYRHHGVSPASGCFPVLIQLPVLWAMFTVLRSGLQPDALHALYSFLPNPGTVDPVSMGILDLGKPAFQRDVDAVSVSWPAVVLALLTGVVTYWQVRTTPGLKSRITGGETAPAEQVAHHLNRSMTLFMPFMTSYVALIFPTGLSLYWFVTTLLAVVHQRYLVSRV